MTVLIPAYNPDERLFTLVQELSRLPYRIIIVDDGSSPDTQYIFECCISMGCLVLRHGQNQGKGAALKTGFAWLKENGEDEGVVCADADGQHLPKDIDTVARKVLECPDSVILGTRRFTGKVPFKSRAGNMITRCVFRLVSGQKIADTQTGLRGYPPAFLEWLPLVQGSRFEYEMNLLLYAAANEIPIVQVDIQTVYAVKGHTSHFHPVTDSIRVYQPILKYCGSSLISTGVDFLLLLVLSSFTNILFLAVAGARIVSASLNYTLNRHFVFTHGRKVEIHRSLPKYALVAGCIMLVNYGIIYAYNRWLGVALVPAKIMTELTIYFFSFWLQRKFVFK